jgi:hypothetical protein
VITPFSFSFSFSLLLLHRPRAHAPLLARVQGNRISDAALFELAEHCPRLEVLYVQCSATKRPRGRRGLKTAPGAAPVEAEDRTDQITNQGIKALATGCPQLR